MFLEVWITVAIANWLSAVAPGQNVALVTRATTRAGIFSGSVATTGILLADLVWCTIALVIIVSANQIGSGVLLGLQIISGIILVILGLHMIRSSVKPAAESTNTPRPKSAVLLGQGFLIGFANPLTLAFFVAMFPLFLPAGEPSFTAQTVGFYGTAVVISGFVALAPYIFASLALAKAGLGRALDLLSGGSLAAIGSFVLAQSALA